MKKYSFIFLIILVFNLNSFSQIQEKKVFFKDCSPEQFKKELDSSSNYLLIDLRSAKEFKKSRIKSAKYFHNDKVLFSTIEKYDKNIPIFIYSTTGDKSLSTAAMLMRNGYNKIYNLKEGIDGWYGDGYKLCKDKIDNTDLVDL